VALSAYTAPLFEYLAALDGLPTISPLKKTLHLYPGQLLPLAVALSAYTAPLFEHQSAFDGLPCFSLMKRTLPVYPLQV
jgi:hypothetical protein